MMSNRAQEFLNRWEQEHVGAVPDDRKLREVVQLTARCRRDAVAAGIAAEELRTAAAQGLIRHMLAAITAANENKPPEGEATEGEATGRRFIGRLKLNFDGAASFVDRLNLVGRFVKCR
jgi:hypothetical protein